MDGAEMAIHGSFEGENRKRGARKAMTTSSRLILGRSAGSYLVAIEGRGTMLQSPAFQESIDDCLREGASTVTVDLSACEYLDSTFLGCLLNLHRKYNDGDKARLEVYAPADVRHELLHCSRLDCLLRFTTDRPEFDDESVEVEISGPDRDVLREHVAEAHRQLAELGGPESDTFGRIARQVGRE
jgi:hypothetical protein